MDWLTFLLPQAFIVGWSAYLSPPALLIAAGWAVASGMAIPQLHTGHQHRLRAAALLTICCLGFVVALMAGAREHEQVVRADEQQRSIADDIAGIAATLRGPKPAADHVLAAAAAALQQQAETLQRQTAELAGLRQQVSRMERLPPNPDVLYKGDIPMAVVAAPSIDAGARRVVFKTVTAHTDLDMAAPFTFRGWLITCTARAHAGLIGAAGIDTVTYWNLPCTISP